MPRKSSPDEPERHHHRLSLAELAAHDDVCTDVMIDNAYFKSRIRKNRCKHIPVRGVKEDEVPKILLQKVIVDKNPEAAKKALLALPGVKRYRNSLQKKPEQEEFLRHFQKYVQMYMTDCPWEVSTTNRYTIITYEAAVTARRRIKQGETIKYLTGTLVPLTAEEDTDLELTQRNFSIVMSSRKKSSSIFLGPARFSNHDCDANGRLVTRGSDGMEVIAMRNIEVGDEITVSYGDDYFGRGNIECLCYSCEKAERNGWTSRDAFGMPAASPPLHQIPQAALYPLRRKRKYDSDSSSVTSCASSKKAKNSKSPSKLQHSWTPPADSGSEKSISTNDLGGSPPQSVGRISQIDCALEQRSPSAFQRRTSLEKGLVAALSNHSSGKGKVGRPRKHPRIDKTTARLDGTLSSPKATPDSQISATSSTTETRNSSQESAQSADTSVDAETTCIIKIESVETRQIESDAQIEPQIKVPEPPPETSACIAATVSPAMDPSDLDVAPAASQAISILTTTKVSKIPQDENEAAILPSVEQATTSHLTVVPVSETIRVPGDYILTRRLLAQPHDRWIFCRNGKCGAYFIQPNGYQTRRECPRCERHSMLYGFPWPKTDPDLRKMLERKKAKEEKSAYGRAGKSGKGTWVEGGGDEEERVMDHRIVHRFVYPDEERETTRRGLLVEAEKARETGSDLTGASFDSLGARFRATGSESLSLARETSQSVTPEDGKRRSGRFVPTRVYADF